MSLLGSVLLWTALAVAVGFATVLAIGFGYCYGRLARGWSDEAAARGTNVVAFGGALLAGIPFWIVADVGVRIDATRVAGDALGGIVPTIAGAVVAPVVSGFVAGGIRTAAVSGILRGRPDLPGVGDPATVRRHYARFITSVFVVICLFITAIGPALRGGFLGLVAVIVGLVLAFWIGSPFLGTLTSSTRRPTDPESARIDELLEAADLTVRGVRVVDADEQYVAIDLAGAPGFRYLFLSRAALGTYDDGTMTALLTVRREQAAHYETILGFTAVVAPLLVLTAVVYGALSAPVGLLMATAVTALGFTGTRRLRYYTDARIAERVGAETLADAFERACKAAGFDLEGTDGYQRRLSTTPSISARIERLREAESAGRRR
jgi:hypothetical protein